MAMSPDVAEALETKSGLKATLKKQCRGRWELVVLMGDGSFAVYNTPEQADKVRRRMGQPPAAPTAAVAEAPKRPRAMRAPATAKVVPVAVPIPPPPRPLPPERQPVVIDLRESHRAQTIMPGVNIVKGPQPESVEERTWRQGDAQAARDFDWSAVDLEMKAIELREAMKNGYPEAMGFWFHADVLALEGMDLEIVETAMRKPERVEIRPESFSKTKGYPVLGFYRGDVSAIVGFREPTKPVVIAAYAVGLLQHDTHRTEGAGGGGAKKREGLPGTPTALMRRLQELGAIIVMRDGTDRAEVKFKNQELGAISVGTVVNRDTVHNDWQRMQRKIHAIANRASASA